jgi:hypothetical protein
MMAYTQLTSNPLWMTSEQLHHPALACENGGMVRFLDVNGLEAVAVRIILIKSAA